MTEVAEYMGFLTFVFDFRPPGLWYKLLFCGAFLSCFFLTLALWRMYSASHDTQPSISEIDVKPRFEAFREGFEVGRLSTNPDRSNNLSDVRVDTESPSFPYIHIPSQWAKVQIKIGNGKTLTGEIEKKSCISAVDSNFECSVYIIEQLSAWRYGVPDLEKFPEMAQQDFAGRTYFEDVLGYQVTVSEFAQIFESELVKSDLRKSNHFVLIGMASSSRSDNDADRDQLLADLRSLELSRILRKYFPVDAVPADDGARKKIWAASIGANLSSPKPKGSGQERRERSVLIVAIKSTGGEFDIENEFPKIIRSKMFDRFEIEEYSRIDDIIIQPVN